MNSATRQATGKSLPPVCEPGLCVIETATYRCANCGCTYTSPQDRAKHNRENMADLEASERRWPASIR